MRALTWQGTQHAEVTDVPDPKISEPSDIVIHHLDRDPLGVRTFATHHLPLEDAPRGYDMFRDKTDGCLKVVLQP
jgi:threonine dehydrogenase-like Zn-dependent dehydrogenase